MERRIGPGEVLCYFIFRLESLDGFRLYALPYPFKYSGPRHGAQSLDIDTLFKYFRIAAVVNPGIPAVPNL